MDLNPYGSLGFLSTLVPLSLATIGVASSPALRSPSLVHLSLRSGSRSAASRLPPAARTWGGEYGWERVGLGGWLRRWATDRLATFPSSFVCLSAHASLSRLTLDPSVVTVHGSLWSSVFRSTPHSTPLIVPRRSRSETRDASRREV